MKKFIITIDTEGDNLWTWASGSKIHTENVLYLNRFQKLCNKYKFKPVWLSNYEMIADDRYVDFITNVVRNNQGELGMHLHAWNSPPDYKLEIEQSGAPYLIEYPNDVIEEKISFLTKYIVERTGIQPVSHRAGRWAMNEFYYEMLAKYGYKIDCSVTPGIDWTKSVGATKGVGGSNYTNALRVPYMVNTQFGSVLETPLTTRDVHRFFKPDFLSIKECTKKLYHSFRGETIWIRPTIDNLASMKYLVKKEKNEPCDYIMFMIHSSELMPGGSPTFPNIETIEVLYRNLEELFIEISKEYDGVTLKEYFENYKDD